GGAMKQTPHTEFHPRWYRRRVSTYWWLGNWDYLFFILRELSSAFVGWSVVLVLLHVRAISQGATAYREFVEWCQQPGVLALNVVTLCCVVYHAATWFNLAPKAMVVRVGGTRVAPLVIILGNYAMWAVASALVARLLLGG